MAIQIAILNLMPTKQETENQFLRVLGGQPKAVDLTFVKTATYIAKNTSAEHLSTYAKFDDIKHRKFDGLIITGAPVETMQFEEVQYWNELKSIMDWAKINVTNTLCICWGAQAALYHHFGIDKVTLPEKLSGVFPQTKAVDDALLCGFDDTFYIPHSRYTGLDETAVARSKGLQVLAGSTETGSSIIKSTDNKTIFLMGHSEYDTDTLDKEYKRDVAKGIDIKPPCNYYHNNQPLSLWQGTAKLLFGNWLKHYVSAS